MLKLIREVIRVGEATVKYPFAPVDLAPGFRGKPVYDAGRCIACGACAVACPPNAIAVDSLPANATLPAGTSAATEGATATEGAAAAETAPAAPPGGVRTWALSYGRCIFCGRCEEVCPTGAIHLAPEFELAVLCKEDLTVRARFTLTSCRVCGTPFAPQKEVDYVLTLLADAGLPGEAHLRAEMLEQRRALLETCPNCKRRQDVSRVGILAPGSQPWEVVR